MEILLIDGIHALFAARRMSFYLTFERYFSIVKPYYYNFSKCFMCTFLVSISSITSVVLFFMFFVKNSWRKNCISYEVVSKDCYITVYLFGTNVKSVVACVLYSRIMYTIYKKNTNKAEFAQRRSVAQTIEKQQNFKSAIFICILVVILKIGRIPYLVSTYLLMREYSSKIFALYRASTALIRIKPVLSFVVYSVKFKGVRNLLKSVLLFGC